MESVTKVALKTGEIFDIQCSEFAYDEGVLYLVDEEKEVVMSVPQENVRYTQHYGKQAEGPVPEKPAAEPQPTTPSVGDTVIVQLPGDEWSGCKRTVIAKLPSEAFVVSKTGEPLSRLYDAQHLRVVPKREESTNG